jgi:SAM-dependent methyltransferase
MSRFESDWRARFERYAHLYSDEAQISGWSAEGLRRRIDLFQRLVESPAAGSSATALELGCGAGTYVRWLAGVGYWTLGLDNSLATQGRAVAAEARGKGRYFAGEAYSIPCRTGSVDLVVSIGVLQALSEPRRAIEEIARVLRPGGALVVEVLNSRAAVATMLRTYQRMKGLPARVATYDPEEVSGWLSDHGIHVERKAPLCLPPRQLPGLGRLLEAGPVEMAVSRVSALSRALAHAVWLVGRAGKARP